jgi:hypothetical protein
MHESVLTAENMIKKGWPCNTICSLCFCMEEITIHLLTEWNYTEAVWNLLAANLAPKLWLLQLGRYTNGVGTPHFTGTNKERKKKKAWHADKVDLERKK